MTDYFVGHGATRPGIPGSPPECSTVVGSLLRLGCSLNEGGIPLYDTNLETTTGPDSTPWSEFLSRLMLRECEIQGPIFALPPTLQSSIMHVLDSGIISMLLSYGADCNSMVTITANDAARHDDGPPARISACALYLLLPFLVSDIWKNTGARYLQDLRTMLSKADYSKLRDDLFGESHLLYRMLDNIINRTGSKPLSRHIKEQQFGAKVLCELGKFDTYGLPWVSLEDVLEMIFLIICLRRYRKPQLSGFARIMTIRHRLRAARRATNVG